MSDNALSVIQNAQRAGGLVYVNMENLKSPVELYKTEVTEIKAKPDEFHKMQGKFMPNKSVVDRIGEAVGIHFIDANCSVHTESRKDMFGDRTVYIGRAQGKELKTDGSWRPTTVESYEFDPLLRAMQDAPRKKEFGKDVGYDPDDPKNASRLRRDVLEYMRSAMARASTGARLRVIRQITGMPETFTAEEINRPMYFSRVVQNTAQILSTPEGRVMATARALGADVSSLLYGRKSDGSQAIESTQPIQASETDEANLKQAEAYSTEPEVSAGKITTLADQASRAGYSDDHEFEDLTVSLEALIESNKTLLDRETRTGNPYKLAKDELDSFTATTESRKSMTAKITKFLEMLNGGAA